MIAHNDIRYSTSMPIFKNGSSFYILYLKSIVENHSFKKSKAI